MNNKKLKWFFLAWLIAMVVFAWASFPEHKPLKKSKEIAFRVLENEELYFKNVRSFYYDKEVREDAQFDLYRIRTRRKDSTVPTVNFVIVNNWRMDEAYVLAEQNFDAGDELLIRHRSAPDEPYDTLALNLSNNAEHYAFARAVYSALAEEEQLEVMKGRRFYPLYQDGKELGSILKTLKDYFKLVGQY